MNDLTSLARAGIKGFKCFLVDSGIEGFSFVDEQGLRSAMPMIAQTGLPLLVHAEDPAVIENAGKCAMGNRKQYATYLQLRPPEAEVVAIERMISLSREYGCRIHIAHLSAADALPLLRRAKEEGVPITVETCPHYLYFAASQIADDACPHCGWQAPDNQRRGDRMLRFRRRYYQPF